jgi:tRNA pseudouridine38-40 synthase
VSLFDPDPEPAGADRHLEGAAPEQRPPAPAGPVVRLRLLVAYDGHGFHGFAAQPGQRTVAGVLGEAIETVVRHPVELGCAGRTDAGVHAWGQVVHVDVVAAAGDAEAPAVEPAALQRACNRLLAPTVVVREAVPVASAFDARRSALSRRYRYTIVNRALPDPFLAATAWHVAEALDLRSMQLACDAFLGEHDFAAFCRRPQGGDPDEPLVRRVLDAAWRETGDGVLRFEIEASSFCQHMVRSIVGTHVDVGLGRKRAGDMSWIIRGRDRALAGAPAPAHGLCLWEVGYPHDDGGGAGSLARSGAGQRASSTRNPA